MYSGNPGALPLAPGTPRLSNSLLERINLPITAAHVGSARGAGVGDKLLGADGVVFKLVDGGVGGLELGLEGGVVGVGEGDFALGIGEAVLQAREVVCLAEGVGA